MITKITDYVKRKIPNVEIQDSVTTNSKYLWLNESSKVRISDHFSSKKPVLNIIIPETQGYFVIIMGYRTHISKSFRETCETIVTFLKLNEGIEEKLKNQSKTITELTTNLETTASELAALKKEIAENQKIIRNLENQVSNFKVSKAQFDRIKDDLTNKKNALSTAENTIKNCENNSQILRDALNAKIAENQKLSDDLKEAASLIEELTTSQELRDMFYNKHSGKKYYLDNFPIEMQELIQDLIKNYYK